MCKTVNLTVVWSWSLQGGAEAQQRAVQELPGIDWSGSSPPTIYCKELLRTIFKVFSCRRGAATWNDRQIYF